MTVCKCNCMFHLLSATSLLESSEYKNPGLRSSFSQAHGPPTSDTSNHPASTATQPPQLLFTQKVRFAHRFLQPGDKQYKQILFPFQFYLSILLQPYCKEAAIRQTFVAMEVIAPQITSTDLGNEVHISINILDPPEITDVAGHNFHENPTPRKF